MNWIEIDKFLYGLIAVSKDEEQLYKDAMKKFNWDRRQAEVAINPLLKRQGMLLKSHTIEKEPAKTRKSSSKK